MVYVTLSTVSSSWLYIAPDRSIMSCGRVSAVGAPGSVSCWFVCWCRLLWRPGQCLVVTRGASLASCRDKASHCSSMQHHRLADTSHQLQLQLHSVIGSQSVNNFRGHGSRTLSVTRARLWLFMSTKNICLWHIKYLYKTLSFYFRYVLFLKWRKLDIIGTQK